MKKTTWVAALGGLLAWASGCITVFERPPLPMRQHQPPGPPICRDLGPGDAWYPEWVHCCDSADQTQSTWTQADGSSGVWDGSCSQWEIHP
jgi:hypothetical protein